MLNSCTHTCCDSPGNLNESRNCLRASTRIMLVHWWRSFWMKHFSTSWLRSWRSPKYSPTLFLESCASIRNWKNCTYGQKYNREISLLSSQDNCWAFVAISNFIKDRTLAIWSGSVASSMPNSPRSWTPALGFSLNFRMHFRRFAFCGSLALLWRVTIRLSMVA